MKSLFTLKMLACLAIMPLTASAQDNTVDEVAEEATSILNDPRLKNMFRDVREDPEKAATEAVQSLKNNSDKAEDAVRNATRVFTDNQDEIEQTAKALTENRGALESTATSAASEISRMLPSAPAEADAPAAPAPTRSEVPATRPAGGNAAPPVAQPTEADAIPSPTVTVTEERIMQEETVQPIATAPTLESQIPDSPFLNPGDIPEPKPLSPRYQTDDSGAYQASSKNEVVITSDGSEMDNKTGIITFMDNVIINHPDFILECDKLVITMAEGANEGGDSASFKRAVATGGTVKIRRISAEGKTQVAISRMADYNGITKDIVLSGGPPYLQDGEKHVRCDAADGQIIMTGDGKYKINGAVEGAPSRHQITFPVEDDGENKTIGIGSSISGGIDRLR